MSRVHGIPARQTGRRSASQDGGDLDADPGPVVQLEQRYDAIVPGSRVGYRRAAALPAHEGYTVLPAEKRACLNGRFSTSDHVGYLGAAGGSLRAPIRRVAVSAAS